MLPFYQFFLCCYAAFIRLAAFFGNTKAGLWVAGRRDIFKKIKENIRPGSDEAPILWVHCASLGEFEQGRPVIEAFLQRFPHYRLVLTFFSPSGYQVRKDYRLAAAVFYLPMDSSSHAKRFLDSIQPALAIFIKYEFWYYYLNELKYRQIPLYLVSANFRPNQVFFRWCGYFFSRMLNCFHHIFVQNQRSADLLNTINIHHYSITGDTRLDSVLTVRQKSERFPLVDTFAENARVWVAGSTWQPDEQLIIDYYKNNIQNKNWKFIIVPHEINEAHLLQIEKMAAPLPCLRYTQANADNIGQANILIMDTMGMLSSLYGYADIAYIGGGFGRGIHNSLEAAVFGIPVLFGPKYQKFAEAKALIQQKIAFSVKNRADIALVFEQELTEAAQIRISLAAKTYFEENSGATEKIISWLGSQEV